MPRGSTRTRGLALEARRRERSGTPRRATMMFLVSAPKSLMQRGPRKVPKEENKMWVTRQPLLTDIINAEILSKERMRKCRDAHMLFNLISETPWQICAQEDQVSLVKTDWGGSIGWTWTLFLGRIPLTCSPVSPPRTSWDFRRTWTLILSF